MLYTGHEKQSLYRGFLILINFFNSLFLLQINFLIPEVIQCFFFNLSLYLLTFLSGTYLFSREFIASRKLFVAQLTFLSSSFKILGQSLSRQSNAKYFQSKFEQSFSKKNWISQKVDQQMYQEKFSWSKFEQSLSKKIGFARRWISKCIKRH